MKKTNLKYLMDTYCFAFLVSITEIGTDEKGLFLIFDKTIGYPGGGGQPMDEITLSSGNIFFTNVLKCDFNGGNIKYYVESHFPELKAGDEIVMNIDRSSRIRNAAYHTAGHWIASIVTENLQVSLTPTKGFHYKDGAYVEFSGDLSLVPEDIMYKIDYAMKIDRQANLEINSIIISIDEFYLKKDAISAPINFQPMPDRPLRLVTFDTYKSVPCGGTHLRNVREIPFVKTTKIKVKNGKIRLSYNLTMRNFIPPS